MQNEFEMQYIDFPYNYTIGEPLPYDENEIEADAQDGGSSDAGGAQGG